MMLKSLLLPSLSSGAVILLVTAGALLAQTSSPPPTPTPTKKVPPSGYIRLINMVADLAATYELSASPDPAAPALASGPSGNYFATYTRINPGRFTVRVSRAGAREKPIKVLDMIVPDKGYFTVYIHTNEVGSEVVELLNDSPDLKASANKLTVRQLFKDARVVVTCASAHSSPLEYGQSELLDNMPKGRVPLQVRAVTLQGVRNWGSEADFNVSHRATVYVVPDSYGRLRVRYSADGPDPMTEKENQEAAAALAAQ